MNAQVLVVADDQARHAIMSAVTQAGGDPLDGARDGVGAIAQRGAANFDLVLLAHGVAERDAVAIAKAIRDPAGAEGQPRLVALTELSDFVVGRELLAGGRQNSELSPPFDLPELLAILTRHRRAAPVVAEATPVAISDATHARRRRPANPRRGAATAPTIRSLSARR